MVDKVDKFLGKLPRKRRFVIRILVKQILGGLLTGMDVKKIRGKKHIYRVRSGRLRIIFYKKESNVRILVIEHRGDTTYKR